MDKDLLWCACCHHILEIMLEAVVLHALGPSKGPEIMIFKRFQSIWQFIDRSDYATVTSDDVLSNAVSNISDGIIAFAKEQLRQFQPRDDYCELLELTITFLGGVPVRGVSFRAPERGGWQRVFIV